MKTFWSRLESVRMKRTVEVFGDEVVYKLALNIE